MPKLLPGNCERQDPWFSQRACPPRRKKENVFLACKHVRQVFRMAKYFRRLNSTRRKGDRSMFSANRFLAKCVFSPKNGPVPGLCSSPAACTRDLDRPSFNSTTDDFIWESTE